MSFESELYSMLSGNAALVALVPADRIQPVHLADGATPPYVAWFRVFTQPRNTLDGNTSGANRVRLQVDCIADDFDEAIAIAAAVRAAVPASGGTLHGLCINEFDFALDDPTRLFRRVVEFSMFHSP